MADGRLCLSKQALASHAVLCFICEATSIMVSHNKHCQQEMQPGTPSGKSGLHKGRLTYRNANQEGAEVMHKVAHFLADSFLDCQCVCVQTIEELPRGCVSVKEGHLLLEHRCKVGMSDAIGLPYTCRCSWLPGRV